LDYSYTQVYGATPIWRTCAIADNCGGPDGLVLTATSQDTTKILHSGITFQGTGANRQIKITPVTGATGGAYFTVTLSNP
jgi:hypothetical protein